MTKGEFLEKIKDATDEYEVLVECQEIESVEVDKETKCIDVWC